jgi:hypothetical protein
MVSNDSNGALKQLLFIPWRKRLGYGKVIQLGTIPAGEYPLHMGSEGLSLLETVFHGSPDIQKGKTELQNNQRIGSISQTPDNPEPVAQ